jgi:hypothetical protein
MLTNPTARLVILLLIGYAITGCSSSNIRSSYDSDADYGAFETYDFIDGAGPDYEGYESLFTQYMIAAITIEMENRGYVKSNNPDLLVNFNANIQQKTQVRQSSSPSPAYYGYRSGYYDPWGSYGTQTHVSQYDEGTFNIDLIDAGKKRLVWEAVGVGRVSEKALKNLEQSVKEGVPEFFASYPFVAGQSAPVAKK